MIKSFAAGEKAAFRSLILAIASLVFGSVGLPWLLVLAAIYAVVFGIIAVRHLHRTGYRLKEASMATAGILLGGFWIVVGFDNFRGGGAIAKAKKVTCLATAVAVESAVNSFRSEYGTMPDVKNHLTTDTADGIKLLTILFGMEDPSGTTPKPKVVKFLIIKEGRNKKGGVIYSPDGKSVEGLYDPWGSPYVVELDTQNKGRIQFTLGNKTIILKDRLAAVYSPGHDKKLGTDDDVLTW